MKDSSHPASLPAAPPDGKEFEQAVFAYVAPLYRSALRLTRNKSDAQDLVQDTVLKAYRFFHRYQRGTNLKAWLFKIMTNLYINAYREKARKPQEVTIEDVEELYLYHRLTETRRPGEANPEETFFGQLYEDEVRRVLDELPADYRLVVVLAFVEEFSYEEIAQITRLRLGTVKSRLFRGRKLLQKKLWDYAVRAGYLKRKREA